MSRSKWEAAKRVDEYVWVSHAYRDIFDTYGDSVSVKPKSLRKFGRTENADLNTLTTVARFQDDVVNETFATGNTVDSIVSTSGSDTVTILVEGHTISGSDLTFVVQTVTLTGQTAVTLTTPLYRCSRMFNTSGTDLAGDVAVYDATEATGLTAGKPNVDTAVKCMIIGSAGRNQSEKAATSFSKQDYFLCNKIFASVSRQSAASTVDVFLQTRDFGGVWRERQEFTISTAASNFALLPLEPWLVCPPNSEIRLVCTSTANNTFVSGGFMGLLALK